MTNTSGLSIERVETIPVAIPFSTGFDIAGGGEEKGKSVIVKLHTNEGLVGIGEASPNPAFAAETQTGVLAVLEFLEPTLRGMDPTKIGEINTAMDDAIVGNPIAKSAVDIACYDLTGKHLDTPVSTLFGGRLRDRIDNYMSIGIKDIESAVTEAREYVDRGFRNIKVKVGADPDRDEERVRAIYEEVHEDAQVQVDANQGYTADVAHRVFSALEDDLTFSWIEQPIPRANIRGMVNLARSLDTPLLADESVYDAVDAFTVAYNEAADMIHVKPSKAGGLYQSLQLVAIATAAGMPVVTANNVQLGVGTAAGTHLAVSLSRLPYPSAHRGPMYFERDILTDPLRIEDGYTYVPDGPGLGVELDHEALDSYATNR